MSETPKDPMNLWRRNLVDQAMSHNSEALAHPFAWDKTGRARRRAAIQVVPTEAESDMEQDRRRATWIRDDKRAEAVEPRPDYKLFVEAAQYEAIVQENETRKRMCSFQQYMIFGLALALVAALVWGAR